MFFWNSTTYSRGSQTFFGHVPLNISTDEHVPLNMGAGRIFLQGGANSGFSRGGPKIFLQGMANSGFSRGGPKMMLQEGSEVVKLHFHHSKLRKQYFCK